jgi:hypothetical protein
MSSKTKVTTFKKLSDKDELGVVLGRLMMAVNDIGICNDGLGAWMGEQGDAIRKERKQGARMYFVRLMISHTFEALQILNKIKETPSIRETLDKCSNPTREAFWRAIKVVGTDQYKFFKDVRNSLAFHYLPNTVRSTVESLGKRVPDVPLSLSIGSDNLQWYYEPGDRIVDSYIVRDVFGLPENADVVAEVDKLIHKMQGVAEDVTLFAGYFIMEAAT